MVFSSSSRRLALGTCSAKKHRIAPQSISTSAFVIRPFIRSFKTRRTTVQSSQSSFLQTIIPPPCPSLPHHSLQHQYQYQVSGVSYIATQPPHSLSLSLSLFLFSKVTSSNAHKSYLHAHSPSNRYKSPHCNHYSLYRLAHNCCGRLRESN